MDGVPILKRNYNANTNLNPNPTNPNWYSRILALVFIYA